MRTLQPANRVRVGALAIAIVVLVVGVGQSFGSLPMLFATASYYAQFTDSGGISKGDKVRIIGLDVGTVQDMSIDGDHILMKFTTGTHTIGTASRVAIRTDTLLGKKVLEIEPRGPNQMRPNDVLPLGQSTTPYQVYDAFFDVTKGAAGWNIDTVKESLNVLSRTINQTYPHLSSALDGVAKFSDIIGKRDDELKHLLGEARKVAGVLGDRSKQINALLRNTQTLLAVVQRTRQSHRGTAGECIGFFGAGAGADPRQPESAPSARGTARRERRLGRTQERPCLGAGYAAQLHRGTQ